MPFKYVKGDDGNPVLPKVSLPSLQAIILDNVEDVDWSCAGNARTAGQGCR